METCPNKFDINIKRLCPLSIFTFQLVYMHVIKYTCETYGNNNNNNIIIIPRHSFNFRGVTYRQFSSLSRKIKIKRSPSIMYLMKFTRISKSVTVFRGGQGWPSLCVFITY